MNDVLASLLDVVIFTMMFAATPPQWYGLVIAGLLLIWLSFRAVTRILRRLISCLCFIFLKYVLYRAVWGPRIEPSTTSAVETATTSASYHPTQQSPRPRRGWDASWFHLILCSIYVGVNVFCICFQASDLEHIASRAGVLATINFLPLLVGTRLSAAADILGLSLRNLTTMHGAFSVMAISESVAHVAINARLNRLQLTAEQIIGIVVGEE